MKLRLGKNGSDSFSMHWSWHKKVEEWNKWTEEMKSVFSNYCGSEMDRWYPGWNS